MRKITGDKPTNAPMRSDAKGKGRRCAERRVALVALFLVSSPAFAGPPYRTDDPEPVDYQHWEFYTFSMGARVSGDTSGFPPAIEFNYGAVPNGQVHIIAPMAFDRATGAPFDWGYGDTELGFKYRLIEQDKNGWGPSVGVYPLIEVPSGDAHRSLGTGAMHAFLPVWLQKDIGDWTTYGGGGYWINPGLGNRNYWFFGWLLQRKITDQLAVGAEVFHQTADKVGGKDSPGFNVGGIYDFTEHYHFLFSIGRGLQHTKETNEFSWYVGIQVTGGDDKPSQKTAPDVSPAVFSWTGFYVGADLGHAWQRANEADFIAYAGPVVSSYPLKGAVGGPFTGFNWQTGSLVLGLEADVEAAAVTGSEGHSLVAMAQRHDVRGSSRARVGVATERGLFYVTGGVALANFFPFALGEPFNQARPGWTIGTGFEYAIAADWSGRVEYRHGDFGSTTYVSSNFDGNFYRVHVRDDTVRAGIAYHLNFAEPGPVVSKY